MTQSQYEAKKALLKRIKEQWRVRLIACRRNEPCDSSLAYSELVMNYVLAQHRLNHFVRESNLQLRASSHPRL